MERNHKNRPTLSQDFFRNYNQFVDEFDELVKDLFQGEKLDLLASDFLLKHKDYIRCFAFRSKTRFPECDNNETLDEDLRIMMATGDEENESTNNNAKILADVYRRACQGCYLRITFNKSRFNQEDDRREAVKLGQHAIRYDSSNFLVSYWYMIALGWQLDVTTNPKERTLVARIFREATMRCIRLDPTDGLAHNLLGRYYYSVAGLSWLERTVAKNLLGCKLDGSYQDSEREFLRAHELKDDWLPTGLWLARVLLAQNRPITEVKRWIDFGLKMECKEPTTELERKELLELKSKLKLCN